MTTRIAYLTAACMLEGHPRRLPSYVKHEIQWAVLDAACRTRGIELVPVVWDDPDLDVAPFSAFVIGTTWDYIERAEAFLRVLESVAVRRPLFNPIDVVRWNYSKAYLFELASRGVPIVPTLHLEQVSPASIAAAFGALGAMEVVIKPVVGAGASRTTRLARGAALPGPQELPAREGLVQPFLPSITKEGEQSLFYFGGVFSHAVRKVPAAGDFRIQAYFGGWEEPLVPDTEATELSQRALAAVDTPLLYARVDLVRDLAGRLAVLELELVEPYLHPEGDSGVGARYAKALERSLDDT